MPLPPRYTDARLLGEGSFATVYAAADSLLGRDVAVKVLREELARDGASRYRFALEVKTAALLGAHPHVVTVHDAGEWLGRPYLVMELLAGSIGERLRTPVSERVALRWLAQAAAALDFAHASGVVHRDVKPSNLLLDRTGDVRLADFGVVRTAGADAAVTEVGAVVGTPGYLAPEVAGGAVATPASDRYSLAVVARELLGDRPELVRGLAREPDDRYPSAGALVAALGGGEERTVVAAPTSARVEPIPLTEPRRRPLRDTRRT